MKMQKNAKIVLLIALSVLLLAVITVIIWLNVGNARKVYSPEQIVNHFNSVVVYKADGKYDVVVQNNGKTRTVVFSPDRKVLKNQGIDLIKLENLRSYIGLSEEEMEKKLGPMHADIGSGFSFPSYITEDGYLLAVYFNDGQVTNCFPYTLFGDSYMYSKADFVSIEIGKSTFKDLPIMPESAWAKSFGLEYRYPLKEGGYMVVELYGPEFVVGNIEWEETSVTE